MVLYGENCGGTPRILSIVGTYEFNLSLFTGRVLRTAHVYRERVLGAKRFRIDPDYFVLVLSNYRYINSYT